MKPYADLHVLELAIAFIAAHETLWVAVSRRKLLGRGLSARPLRKRCAIDQKRARTRFILWWCIAAPADFVGPWPVGLWTVVFWSVAIGFLADDLIFGSDRWKRKWAIAKNKIKWRMSLSAPATPSWGA